MRTDVNMTNDLEKEIERCLLRGTRQTIGDLVDVYHENEDDIYVVVNRNGRNVAYIRQEHPVLREVSGLEIKACDPRKLDRSKLRKRDPVGRLISQIDGGFRINELTEYDCPDYSCRGYRIIGTVRSQGERIKRFYVESTQVNYVRV